MIHEAHAHFVGETLQAGRGPTAAQASCSCGWKGPLHNNFGDRPIDRWNAAARDRDTHTDAANR